ncbi:MAG: hypothetical protein ABL983_06585 [Nitrospira sp.]
MNSESSNIPAGNLHAGDLVEVLSVEEILATLDAAGTCESLPFMPEMLKFCGQRFHVFKRANKVCDTIDKTGFRRMQHTALLDGSRCDGVDHGGCQAGCMILWKEQWLKPLPKGAASNLVTIEGGGQSGRPAGSGASHEIARARLVACSRSENPAEPGREVYRCQITELKKASFELPWWDLRVYLVDVSSRNRRLGEVVSLLFIMLFNWVQGKRRGNSYPYIEVGRLTKTPVHSMNLKPGDKVRVKSLEEIQGTLDGRNKNRGLFFDVGMARYCGHTFRVAERATKIIHEKTGEMIRVPEDNPMILLDGVICHADYQKFCTRSEYAFWREIWLEKIEGDDEQVMPACSEGETCDAGKLI